MQVLHFNSLLFYKKIDLEICPACFVLFLSESLCNPGCREHMILWIIDVNLHTQLLECFFPENHSSQKGIRT